MEYSEDSDQDIDEWQQIQHPFPDETSPTVRQSSGGLNTIVITENYLPHGARSSILPPPTHHEASQIVPAGPAEGNASPSPTSLASSSSCVSDEDVSPMPSPTPSGWRPRVAEEGRKLLKLRFEAIRDGVVRVGSKVRDYAICVGAFWSITYVTGVAAAAALLVYVGIQRRRRRRKLHQGRMDHLACLLSEKDEVKMARCILSLHIPIFHQLLY